jgi:RNA polymerase sigma-70 factor (ECF subfamily)
MLIALAAGGDSGAFGRLVEPHLGLFFSGINRVLGNTADAQDALQNALLGMFQGLGTFEARSRFSSWAYRICINAALMFRRSSRRFREEAMDEGTTLGRFDERGHHLDGPLGQPWSVEPEALAEAERRQLRQCLLEALAALPEAQRVVFVLRDLEDWSTEEIADRLEQTPAAIRQRLHRARLQIQERLKQHVLGRPS